MPNEMEAEIKLLREALAPFARFNEGLRASSKYARTYGTESFYTIENSAGVFELRMDDFKRAEELLKKLNDGAPNAR